MKQVQVTHTLWPVSYIDDDGVQQDILYTFDPSRVAPDYIVGPSIQVVATHPDGMNYQESHRAKKIIALREKLHALEAGQ